MFRREHSSFVKVKVTSYDDVEGNAFALLETHVWELLAADVDDSHKFAITLFSAGEHGGCTINDVQRCPSFTFWCRADDNITGLVLPRSYLEQYPSVFSGFGSSFPDFEYATYIRYTVPPPLSAVTLLACSKEAYDTAISHPSEVQHEFLGNNAVLQSGQTLVLSVKTAHTLGLGSAMKDTIKYTIVSAEPSKGFFKESFTNVLLTATASSISENLPGTNNVVHSSSDDITIDERFLAGSIVEASSPRAVSSGSPSTTNAVRHRIDMSSEMAFVAKTLLKGGRSDDHSLYTSTGDLGKLGLLSGDWATARSSQGVSARLVRVHALDSSTCPSNTCLIPSTLFCNIFNDPTGTPQATGYVVLRPSPYGRRKPSVPIARNVTIARVASPSSTKRSNETAFHRALQEYFEKELRIVKKGDIIAVMIDSAKRFGIVEWDDVQLMSHGRHHHVPASEFITPPKSDDEFVYFVVTNVEHDVVQATDAPASMDAYLDSNVGELGCWVNPTVTRIMQEGIEHARAPPLVDAKNQLVGDTMSPFSTLYHLTAAALSKKAADFHLPLTVLLEGGRGVGKLTQVSMIAKSMGLHVLEVNCYDVIGESSLQTEAVLQTRFEGACACSPCIILLRHLHAFGQTSQASGTQQISEMLVRCMENLRENWILTTYPVFVFATTSVTDQVSAPTLALFKHRVVYESPADSERKTVLETLLAETTLQPDISLKELATETAAFLAGDLSDLVLNATRASSRRLISEHITSPTSAGSLAVASQDFTSALKAARASFSESIGAPHIPAVSWDDVGGIADVKANILDTIQLPLEHPELFAGGLKKRSGILLYGPPGTGKTLLAKAVATSFALNFFSVKGPELLNMYIGESEANVRRVFQRAKDAKPCVIFFDELDSIAPKRGNQGDSGGVMDRIVSQLLAELDGVSSGGSGSDIFVIGATNRPDLLDPALLRPGRFDRLLYLGVSSTKDAQLDILHALTRKFKLHPDLRLDQVAEACTFNFTGADFYALCADALLKAMSRKATEIDDKIANLNTTRKIEGHPYPLTPQYYLAELADPHEVDVLVTQEDFTSALHSLVPSVSPAEMEHYRRVQRQFGSGSSEDK
ncbi:unnamed protein product [Somion occarium]|uniref:Peroxisomal ATPase PEX6 n=1 Tax=Somion occarium TaxID=3059160 RepID=A0ABP1DA11_9APHY